MIWNLLDWRGMSEPAGLVSIALFLFAHAHININSLLFLDEAKLANELLIRFGLGDRTKTVFPCNDVAARYFDKHASASVWVCTREVRLLFFPSLFYALHVAHWQVCNYSRAYKLCEQTIVYIGKRSQRA